jgi:dUTPase
MLHKEIDIGIDLLYEDSQIPIKASEHAGAYDVFLHTIEIKDGLYICWLGFKLKIPQNFRVMLQPRSSITKTELIMQNSPGCGDADFLGEYSIRFRKLNYEEFPYKPGDRIGQMYFEEVIKANFILNDIDSTSSKRGEGSFGSTGS